MPKKYAHKQTKELVPEATLKEQALPKGDYSNNWQGRIIVLNVEKSDIAKQIGIEKNGEFALKVK
jgi:RNA polymerase subunit RPABC4/transcription elongation factor Spt4